MQIDRARQSLVAVERAPSDSRYLAIVDHGDSVLKHSQPSSYKSDVERLPNSRYSGLFWIWRNKSVHASRVELISLRFLVGFNLQLIAATQIHSAVRRFAILELDMQLEVAELRGRY